MMVTDGSLKPRREGQKDKSKDRSKKFYFHCSDLTAKTGNVQKKCSSRSVIVKTVIVIMVVVVMANDVRAAEHSRKRRGGGHQG